MNVKSFESIINSEQSAQSYFRRLCWKNEKRYCVRCRATELYTLAGKKYRCKHCSYTFHDFSRRWINKCKISSQNWLRIVRLFDRNLTAQQISKQVDISYPTILKALEIIRLSVIANSAEPELWLTFVSPASSNHRDNHNQIYPFGIIEEQGNVQIELAESLPLEFILKHNPKILRRSSICYVEAPSPYSFFVLQDNGIIRQRLDAVDHRQPSPANEHSDFWRFAKSKILKHHGIAKAKFPQYLKELEFRYNHRNQSVFDILCRYLVSFIPE